MRTETEIDHDFEYKVEPHDARHLRRMFFSAMLVGVFCGIGIVTVIIHADVVDSFLNTLVGAFTLVGIFGAVGLTWLIWRIKKMIA